MLLRRLLPKGSDGQWTCRAYSGTSRFSMSARKSVVQVATRAGEAYRGGGVPAVAQGLLAERVPRFSSRLQKSWQKA
ncbi:hypothetical protein GCM10023238_17100 [Streptomyces heliomycini]